MPRSLYLHGWHGLMPRKRSFHPFPRPTRSTNRSTNHGILGRAETTQRHHQSLRPRRRFTRDSPKKAGFGSLVPGIPLVLATKPLGVTPGHHEHQN